MTHQEDDHSGATASVTTLPTLFVIVTRDTESGSANYSVSGSYGVTSGIIAGDFTKSVRELYMKGLGSLNRESTSSLQHQSQQDQEQGSTSLPQDQQQQQKQLGRSRKDIESSFASTLPTWKAQHDRIIRTTPHIGDRKAHFKSINGTSVQVITEEKWEAKRARLRDGTLITQYGLDGTTLESTLLGRASRRDGDSRKTRWTWAEWCGSCFTGERH